MLKRIWIGGSPCSGKSTIAERLGASLDLPVYHADNYFDQHAQRADISSVFKRINSWSPQQIFIRDTGEMLADFIALGHEEFPMILDDLKSYKNGVVIEGCALLPELISPLIDNQNTALYLLPTESFQRFHYAQRPWINNILEQTLDPSKAWENWRARDALYTEVVKKQAEQFDLPTLTVDETLSQDSAYNLVESRLSIDARV